MVIEIRKIKKRFIPIFKKFTKSIQAQCLIYDEKSSMKKAIEEIERGEVEVFEDFEAYKKAMKSV